jgi:hypothetical protein
MPDGIEHVATPLHIAAKCGHAKLIPVLLEVSIHYYKQESLSDAQIVQSDVHFARYRSWR